MNPQQAHHGAQTLRPETLDLWGSRLIEASAGTGKTWTIAALYLRLVLGHGNSHGAGRGFARALRPPEILVMTFTRAATRELSDRIRARLLQAAQCFRGELACTPDPFLATLLADYPEGPARSHGAWALDNAAQNMDEAAIYTIDAWCQRMLHEHAFDSGSLLEETLVADEEALRTEAAQDYWRQGCYPLEPSALQQVMAVWPHVEALVADMRALAAQPAPAPTPTHAPSAKQTLADVLAQASAARALALQKLRQGWAERAQAMQDWLDGQLTTYKKDWDGRRLSPTRYNGWLKSLQDWASGTVADALPALKTGWQRLTPEGLQEARKPGAPTLAAPQFFAEFARLQADYARIPEVGVALRLHAASWVRARLQAHKRQSATFGFADLLERLHAALHGQHGQRLRLRMVQQYPVALVDEFQDTSPLQYQILDQIYQVAQNAPDSALLLIGDPKQSIYGFRGADMQSYLQARRATLGRHYALQTNFRSTATLVGAVNHCFAQAERRQRSGAFGYLHARDNPLPFNEVQAQGLPAQLVDAHGPLPAMAVVHALEVHNSSDMRQRFSELCATQIVAWLADTGTGFVTTQAARLSQGATFTRLRPADIAILVRTGKEANSMRAALARQGVASVYLSDRDSVFASPEARDVVHWLRAVANPQDVRLVRAGLATTTIGLSLDTLGWLAEDDDAFDQRSEQLRALRVVWQSQGVLAMLRQTIHQLDLAALWRNAAQGERRLTNFLHLAELLQTASGTLDGEHALVRWLCNQIDESAAPGEAQIVRLESDADLVKIVTVHKSKGLQYPLVCLPFACSFREKQRKTTRFVDLPGEDGKRQLLLHYSSEQLVQADADRLREDLRVLYVALTRAQHSVWLGFSALKAGNSAQCVVHKSALGHLLGGDTPREGADWLAELQELARGHEGILLQEAPHTSTSTSTNPSNQRNTRSLQVPSAAPAALRDMAPYQAHFERDWTIGSFSRMGKNLSKAGGALSELLPIQVSRPADDEGFENDGAAAQPLPQPERIHHRFSRGSKTGNFLHTQLEWLAAEQFSLPDNPSLQERLRKRCANAGYAEQADALVKWLTEVVQSPLPGPGAALCQIDVALPEMEFWLVAQHMESAKIDALCQQHLLANVARPALAQQQLQGMLMGFVDLVFEHQGRYWVLDYKSNHLGPDDAAYSHSALQASMAQHRYDVQASLYLLALHRLLRARLGSAYDPARQIGGAVYLYLRGVHGPARGVCLIPPELALLEALDSMLAPVPEVL